MLRRRKKQGEAVSAAYTVGYQTGFLHGRTTTEAAFEQTANALREFTQHFPEGEPWNYIAYALRVSANAITLGLDEALAECPTTWDNAHHRHTDRRG